MKNFNDKFNSLPKVVQVIIVIAVAGLFGFLAYQFTTGLLK